MADVEVTVRESPEDRVTRLTESIRYWERRGACALLAHRYADAGHAIEECLRFRRLLTLTEGEPCTKNPA